MKEVKKRVNANSKKALNVKTDLMKENEIKAKAEADSQAPHDINVYYQSIYKKMIKKKVNIVFKMNYINFVNGMILVYLLQACLFQGNLRENMKTNRALRTQKIHDSKLYVR